MGPGVPTDSLVLLAQTFCSVARSDGMLPSLPFFDLQAAYYRTIRQVVAPLEEDDIRVRRMLYTLGLPHQALSGLKQKLEDISELQRAQAPAHLLPQVSDFFRGTWFRLDASAEPCSEVVFTARGSRPGCPAADLLFSLSFSAFQRANELALSAVGVATELISFLPFASLPWWTSQRRSRCPVPAGPMIWSG